MEHRAIADRDRQLLVVAREPSALADEEAPRGFIFPRFGYHREHDVERAPGGRLPQRARLHLEQPFAFEREAPRAPAHRRIFLLRAALDIPLGPPLVAAAVDGAETHRPVARRVEPVAQEPLLTVETG